VTKSLSSRYEGKIKRDYKKLKRAYMEVKDSYAEMIFRLALVAEHRDEATGTHLIRIADYSTEIAMAMRLPKKEIELLKYASPMHDIGKLVIPDKILKKPGGLTPDEREIMKRHTVMGADIFKGSKAPVLKTAMEICLTHHERYDGTGYPLGLRGKDIPLNGRIVAVADVFDALTSKRPYKEAFGFEESMGMVKEQAGKHFDPEIVSHLLRIRRRIKEIHKATKDIEEFLVERKI
jgi:putative two-component system response regulator